MNQDEKRNEKEIEEKKDEKLEEYGQVTMEEDGKRKIHLLSIIGEVEGHENAPSNSKTTKYDHVLPMLAQLEDDEKIKGMLVLLNTSGGDVDAGLAIPVHAHSVPGSGRKPFHRCASGRLHRLFFYCAYGHHDGSPGADDRNGHRGVPDL